MKLAIVFDDLIQFGGAERLLLAAHEIWPNAPIYTSMMSEEWKKICAEKGIVVHTSFMQKLPLKEKLYKHFAPFLLYPIAFENFDLSEYDIVLSMSTRFAHGVVLRPEQKHICYMNSPGRMFWEPFDYFAEDSSTKRILSTLLTPSLSILRMWDYKAAQHVDSFIANSITPQQRIKQYYKRNSDIIYPFVDFNDEKTSLAELDDNYFLVISRLVDWKKIENAILACEKLGLNLKIIGHGPDRKHLEQVAGSNTEFLGWITEEEKVATIKRSKAIIITQHEDFGIVPLEAMYHGKPVIAYGAGGVLETVIPGKTGEFYYSQTPESLAEALISFDSSKYSFQDCREQAKKFSRERFKKSLGDYVNSVYCNLHSHVSTNAGANTIQN